MSDTKSNVSIWKIRDDLFNSKDTGEIVETIKTTYNKSVKIRSDLPEEQSPKLRELPIKQGLTLEDNHVRVFSKSRYSTGWQEFLSPVVTEETASNSSNFGSLNKDLIVFIYDTTSIFAVTTGAGFFVIKDYIDEEYPFEIAKRVLNGDFKHAETRALTGITFSEAKNFRRNYSFNASDAFGRVWKKLLGEVDKDFLQKTKYIKDFVDVNKTLNAEIRSSFTLRKSITMQDLLKLINEIRYILSQPLSDEKKRMFSFLNSAEIIKDKATQDRLKDELFRAVHERVVAGRGNEDFDFCHPKEALKFLSAKEYSFSIRKRQEEPYKDNPPSYEQIVYDLSQREELAGTDFDDFKKVFESISFRATYEDDNGTERLLSEKLWKHLHGEICVDNVNYFLIDGKWYRAPEPFLATLQENFIDTLNEPQLLEADVEFIDYPEPKNDGTRDMRESRFNQSQALKDNFYFGDEVYARYGNGQVELFDLLFVDNKRLFVIQSKDGFGASMRDACSQLTMSAQAIEDDLRNGKTMLSRYYGEWRKALPTNNLSEEDFLNLFTDREIIYVLACAHEKELTKASLSNRASFRSHIAKFELVGIVRDFRAQRRKIRLMRIRKTG